MADDALHRPRRRALPVLAALLASAALTGAPGTASAADPGLTLTALSPSSWWQADGTFKVPLKIQLGDLISIDRLEIEIVGLPGILSIPAPIGPVSILEGPGLSISLPGIAGTRTIRVTAWVVGQPSYGVGPLTETVTAQTVVTLAPPASQPGGTTGPVVTPISNAPVAAPRVGAPKVLLLRIRTIKGKRYAFVKSSAAVRLELVTNRRVGRKWRAAKRVRTNLVAQKIRRVPLARLAPGAYLLKAVVRDKAGRTGTRSVKLAIRLTAARR